MHNILLIGAGQLGSRHLQGLMKCNLPVRIEVVEPDERNRNTAAERAKQIEGSGNVTELSFRNSIDEIMFSEADLAIIATNSDVRADVIVKLTTKVNVRHLILEKVVYQSLEIFDQQICLIEALGIKTWVNYPRRIYPFYRNLKNELPADEKVSLTISGSNWGLGCNSLHFIDLFSFLTGKSECKTDYALLDPEILQSKRPGFVEFSGRMGFSPVGQGGGSRFASKTTRRASRSPSESLDYNAYARFLAGLPTPQGKWQSYEKMPAWIGYAEAMNRGWQRSEAQQLKPMREWASKELDAARTDTVFYPFSGPDFASLYTLFPHARTYIMVALDTGDGAAGSLRDLRGLS